MRPTLDLNCAPIDQYPATLLLTKSDLTTSELLLPRHSIEEFVVPNMPPCLRLRLREFNRADMSVLDDENQREHFMTMVHHHGIYTLLGWNQVTEGRCLKEGQFVRFGWMDGKLHFIVTSEAIEGEEDYFADNDNTDEDYDGSGEKREAEGEGEGQNGPDNNIGERPAKKRKMEIGESSNQKTTDVNP